MFPSHDEFAQIPFNSMNQENLSIPSQSTSESSLHKNLFNKKKKKPIFSLGKNTTSISSNDDDTEVANSFPNNDLTNKTTPFPILQVPRLSQSNVRICFTIHFLCLYSYKWIIFYYFFRFSNNHKRIL